MPLTATYVKTLRECFPDEPGRPGRQVLLRLEGKPDRAPVYVVASAANISAGPFASSPEEPETYFFRSDPEGNISSSMELTGSQAGTLDIQKCVADAGYILVGWREDIADDHVATIEEALPWTPTVLETAARDALLALRERVREAELQGYRRGVLAARKVWKRRAKAMIEMQNADGEMVALLPERAR